MKEIAQRRCNQCMQFKIPALLKFMVRPLCSHGHGCHLKCYSEILRYLQEDKALEKPHHFVSVYEAVLIPRLYSG